MYGTAQKPEATYVLGFGPTIGRAVFKWLALVGFDYKLSREHGREGPTFSLHFTKAAHAAETRERWLNSQR